MNRLKNKSSLWLAISGLVILLFDLNIPNLIGILLFIGGITGSFFKISTKKMIVIIMIPNIILAYFVYDSINNEVEFQKLAKVRIAENIQQLKDIRAIQIAYKSKYQSFSDDFDSLMIFLNTDSIAVIRSEGEVPDSLTELQALESGVISRDTAYIDANSHIFNEDYIETRNDEYPLDIKQLRYIPYTANRSYEIDAGSIEKGEVVVQVFEVSATYKDVLIGLNAENKKYDLANSLRVGSMSEASLNGNWGE
ncbi:MAG: hypothetical protein VYD71_04010 [Bacteroidota bacterium]|nr:hypothetical protein [Bacteroidota bacterium]